MEVTNHLMPVITGAQGKGKSTFVQQLCSPLKDTMIAVDFDKITDNRELDIWNAHILFLDEMGFASRADIDVVKNRITSPTISGRPMGTNQNVMLRQCATFIGCTNSSTRGLSGLGESRSPARRYEPRYVHEADEQPHQNHARLPVGETPERERPEVCRQAPGLSGSWGGGDFVAGPLPSRHAPS
jgi:hypothetical protein